MPGDGCGSPIDPCCIVGYPRTTGGGGAGELHMIEEKTKVAGNSDPIDIPCLDIVSGVPFKPRRVDVCWVDENGGGTFNAGSRGIAHLTDGTALVAEKMAFQSFPILGGNTYWDIYVGAWIVSGNGFLVNIITSGVATTLRQGFTVVGAGYPAVGTIEIWGSPA